MGAAWCRKKAEAAQNSKSPIDRVLVRCVQQICPDRHSTDRIPPPTRLNLQNSEPKQLSFVGPPLPIRVKNHASPKRPLSNSVVTRGWEDATLTVPDRSDNEVQKNAEPPAQEPPVPPPRKKKLKRQRDQQKKQTLHAHSDRFLKPRPKNYSTVSLPEYRELEKVQEEIMKKSSSSQSLSSLKVSALKEATAAKLEEYMKRCGSFGEFNKERLIEEMNRMTTSESSDSEDFWEDWDLSVGGMTGQKSPVEPTCVVPRRRKLATVDRGQQTVSVNGACCVTTKVEDPNNNRNSNRECSIIETSPQIPPPVGFESNDMSVSETFHCMAGDSDKKVSDKTTKTENNNDKNYSNGSVINIDVDIKTKPNDNKINGTVELKNKQNDQGLKVFDFSRYIRPISLFSDDKTKDVVVTKTPPPSPEVRDDVTLDNVVISKTEDNTHSNLLRILREYGDEENGRLSEKGAEKVLLKFGVPLSLREPETNIVPVHQGNRHRIGEAGSESSGHSSMTPSLSELEQALSELLESAVAADDESDEEDYPKQGQNHVVKIPNQQITLQKNSETKA